MGEDGDYEDEEQQRQDEEGAPQSVGDQEGQENAGNEPQEEDEEEPFEDPYPSLTVEQLEEILKSKTQALQDVEFELKMFQGYADRHIIQEQEEESDRDSAKRKRKAKKYHQKAEEVVETVNELNPGQKCEIASKEIDTLHTKISIMKRNCEEQVHALKAAIEEGTIRISETLKLVYDFNREVIVGGTNEVTGKVFGEKIALFHDERNRQRRAAAEKIRLQCEALKITLRKLDKQLRQKEELGEALHTVDFDQLKIENAQFLERISQSSEESMKGKLDAVRSSQLLNGYKNKLDLCVKEHRDLIEATENRQRLYNKLDEESNQVEKEKNAAIKLNEKYKKQLAEYRVPDVMTYVQEKAEVEDLRNKVRQWEHKADIAKNNLTRNQREWRATTKSLASLSLTKN